MILRTQMLLAAWVGLYVRSGRGPLVMKRPNRIIRDNPEAVGFYRAVAKI